MCGLPASCLRVQAWLESVFDCLDHDGDATLSGHHGDGASLLGDSYWEKYCSLFEEHARLSDVQGWTVTMP